MTPGTYSAEREDHDKSKDILLPTKYDLWGTAYRQLAAENRSLAEDYERLLRKETDLPSEASIQERAKAVLLLKQNQILRKQWRLQWGHRSLKSGRRLIGL